jgi:hypothetical protein
MQWLMPVAGDIADARAHSGKLTSDGLPSIAMFETAGLGSGPVWPGPARSGWENLRVALRIRP